MSAHLCPRRLYLGQGQKVTEPGRYTVCKQVSYHLGGPLREGEIWREIRAILPAAGEEESELLAECITACSRREWPRPVQTDVPVLSAEHGIGGTVDKIFEGYPSFGITRPSEAPSAGVYGADRIRAAAYALCIRESLGMEAESAYVEYIPSGVLRVCTPSPRDRRMLLRAIGIARRVLSGEIPPKPVNAPCARCPHSGRCDSAPRRLSDLL